MTTTPHANLTGTDLHEIKGASTATIGQVPVANGAGNAPFALLTAASLTGTGNPFGAQLLYVREEQASGVASTNAGTTGSFITTILNTVKTNEISGAGLASSIITLPAGTYYIQHFMTLNISSGTNTTWAAKPRLWNNTTSASILDGRAAMIYGSNSGSGTGSVIGRFTLTGTSSLVLQHYKNGGNLGTGLSTGTTEVYSDVQIWKVA